MLDIYWITLILLVPAAAVASGHGLFFNKHQTPELAALRKIFLSVYLVVMGSEWLQGPYMYTLFKDEKGLSESIVAVLYLTSYTAAAISALGTGFLADRYGRRAACLVFCVIHSASSLTVLSSNLEILIIGRILAGIALTLLWTVFESWIVTEAKARQVQLGDLLTVVTTSNCMTAIIGGVLGHCMILAFGSRMNPFLIGITLDAVAVVLILLYWNENYGSTTPDLPSSSSSAGGGACDSRVWLLTFISCAFEGATFLVLYFWPILLAPAHSGTKPTASGRAEDQSSDQDHNISNGDSTSIPHGVIFASFMGAMVLGAVLFQRARRWPVPTSTSLSLALLLSALSLLGTAFFTTSPNLYFSFLLFEFCNGIYVPGIALLRGVIVRDSNRTGTYGLMRIPLFVFVIAALLTTDGERHRDLVLGICAGLVAAAGAGVWWLGRGLEETCTGWEDARAKEEALLEGEREGGVELLDVPKGGIGSYC